MVHISTFPWAPFCIDMQLSTSAIFGEKGLVKCYMSAS